MSWRWAWTELRLELKRVGVAVEGLVGLVQSGQVIGAGIRAQGSSAGESRGWM